VLIVKISQRFDTVTQAEDFISAELKAECKYEPLIYIEKNGRPGFYCVRQIEEGEREQLDRLACVNANRVSVLKPFILKKM